jgi:hypothetical protein
MLVNPASALKFWLLLDEDHQRLSYLLKVIPYNEYIAAIVKKVH